MTPIPSNEMSQKRTVFACEICIYMNFFNAQYVRSILKLSMWLEKNDHFNFLFNLFLNHNEARS